MLRFDRLRLDKLQAGFTAAYFYSSEARKLINEEKEVRKRLRARAVPGRLSTAPYRCRYGRERSSRFRVTRGRLRAREN